MATSDAKYTDMYNKGRRSAINDDEASIPPPLTVKNHPCPSPSLTWHPIYSAFDKQAGLYASSVDAVTPMYDKVQGPAREVQGHVV